MSTAFFCVLKIVTDISDYYGRLCLKSRFDSAEDVKVRVLPAFDKQGHCQRCGQKDHADLPNGEFFCIACLQMGRNSSLACFHWAKEPAADARNGQSWLTWQGTLTNKQQQVASEIIESIDLGQDRLVWAVTGAGKTEMIFPAINHALKQGKRVAMVSPRIDVILELAPRLRSAFSDLDLLLLYGDTPEKYHYTKLVLATTHQLLKFKEAFDLLIIDEVDSFPFRGDPMLAFAAEKAKKHQSSTVYLTATPTAQLIKDYRQQRLPASFLPLRFHGHLLPVLTFTRIGDWHKQLTKGRLPKKLVDQILLYAGSGQRFLLFLPRVKDLAPVLKAISKITDIKGLAVHAADPQRKEKVQQMRDKSVQFLVTTTILERGVTFPGIDVLILGADDEIFSTNAIVQIAGRVGRNNDRPTGLVLAFIEEQTRVLKAAAAQIVFMNRKGQAQRDGQ